MSRGTFFCQGDDKKKLHDSKIAKENTYPGKGIKNVRKSCIMATALKTTPLQARDKDCPFLRRLDLKINIPSDLRKFRRELLHGNDKFITVESVWWGDRASIPLTKYGNSWLRRPPHAKSRDWGKSRLFFSPFLCAVTTAIRLVFRAATFDRWSSSVLRRSSNFRAYHFFRVGPGKNGVRRAVGLIRRAECPYDTRASHLNHGEAESVISELRFLGGSDAALPRCPRRVS